MKIPTIVLAGVSLALVSSAIAVQADAMQFGKLRDAVKTAKEKIDKVDRAADQATSTNGGTATIGQPSSDLTGLTNCAGLQITNVMTGSRGEYTFQQGLSQEKRTGFLNRQPGAVSDGCILPSIVGGQDIYFEVDEAAYDAMGNSNDWEMQCVEADTKKPATQPYPLKAEYLLARHMLLHCGNSEGISECESGSNAKRGDAWLAKLDAQGKKMMSVTAPAYHLEKASGTKLYCQWYNKPSGKSLFGIQMLRTKS